MAYLSDLYERSHMLQLISENYLSKQHWGHWGITGNPLNDMEITNPSSCLWDPACTMGWDWSIKLLHIFCESLMLVTSVTSVCHVLQVLTWRKALIAASQFDAFCQDLWEDSPETSPQRAMENCAQHHWENNCSASAEWPEREFDQLSTVFPFLELFSSCFHLLLHPHSNVASLNSQTLGMFLFSFNLFMFVC